MNQRALTICLHEDVLDRLRKMQEHLGKKNLTETIDYLVSCEEVRLGLREGKRDED